MQKPALTLKRRINASPEAVFAAWTDPEKLALWFGPTGVTTVEAETDPRPGGGYRILMHDANGETHDVGGVYKDVVVNERLVFTWAWQTTPERESLVTVTLKADGPATILTLTHERFFDEAARDRHLNGWGPTLENLAALFPQDS